MILLFSNIPVSTDNKINNLVERAKQLYNSDYHDISKQRWLADELTVESLFPEWITKAAANDSNVLVVSLIKNYMRWLLSLELGYGAQLNWENIRTPLLANDVFLEAYIDFCFPNADFSQDSLKANIPNIRKFLINADTNYFNIKGTPPAIKYLISNLLGIPWDSVRIFTSNTNILTVQIASAKATAFNNYKPFLEKHVFPAGIAISYETF